MSRVVTDVNGFVRGFPYHDGLLEGVLTLVETKDVHLGVRALSGEANVITLRQVEALHVADFLQGNIVFDMRVLPARDAAANTEVRAKLLERFDRDATKLSEDATVFWLTSSYGAELLAVCREVEVIEGRLAASCP